MKYYLIAGEASGDLHGSNLVKALQKEDTAADIRAWGGDLMSEAGATVVKHYRDLAFMGFLEVLKNLRTIMRNFRFCKSDVSAFQPDVLILIDYPGFNLRMAKWAKSQGIRVFYYISPQLWAWHSSRVHQIKANVERMFVILPFETDFYRQYDYKVDFVGHPLLDVIADRPHNPALLSELRLNDDPIIALLPGSRRQEIQRMLSVMLQVIPDFPNAQFVIAGAPAIPRSFYEQIIQQTNLPEKSGQQLYIAENRTYDLLQYSHAALVTSGTATLETALFGVPQVVCYSGNPLSYWIARRLVNVKYISLVNLIIDRPLVKELIQHELTPENLISELHALLGDKRTEILEGYRDLQKALGESGASARAAKLIVGE
ncbi:MAG: lipid-A-disaccharide synthase [Saprospiraceae bacterium]|nr:lipid-A-disaccharide synthase [Saprospiraceae bacterium]